MPCAQCCVSVIDGTLGYLWLCLSSALHGQQSEHVFKMAACGSSTSSKEMASSSEDSASEDPINIAKGCGADLKEAEIARTRKVQRNQAGGKKTVRGQKDPRVSAYQPVRENRNEFLSVTSKNMLRCDACKETISKKKMEAHKLGET